MKKIYTIVSRFMNDEYVNNTITDEETFKDWLLYLSHDGIKIYTDVVQENSSYKIIQYYTYKSKRHKEKNIKYNIAYKHIHFWG